MRFQRELIAMYIGERIKGMPRGSSFRKLVLNLHMWIHIVTKATLTRRLLVSSFYDLYYNIIYLLYTRVDYSKVPSLFWVNTSLSTPGTTLGRSSSAFVLSSSSSALLSASLPALLSYSSSTLLSASSCPT